MSDTPLNDIHQLVERRKAALSRWVRDKPTHEGLLSDLDSRLAERVPELLSRIAELSRKAARWDECERIAEARGFTTNEWVLLFRTNHGTLEEQVDASIAERAAIEAREEETNQ